MNFSTTKEALTVYASGNSSPALHDELLRLARKALSKSKDEFKEIVESVDSFKFRTSLLEKISYEADFETVKLLMEKGVYLSCKKAERYHVKSFDFLKYLEEKGAEIKNDETLLKVIECGDLESLKYLLLLREGKDLPDGTLSAALFYEREENLKYLFSIGAFNTVQLHEALRKSLEYDLLQSMEFLLNVLPRKEIASSISTLGYRILANVANKNFDLIPRLVELGLEIEETNHFLLKYVVNGGDLQKVRKVLELYRLQKKRPILHFENTSDPLELAKLMVSFGAEDTAYQTHKAVREGKLELVKFLIEAGFYQPDLILEALDHFEMTQYLLEKGADPNYNNGEPLARAIHNKIMVRYLLMKGADPTLRKTYLLRAGCCYDATYFMKLYNAGAVVDLGDIPSEVLSGCRSLEAFRIFLEHGAPLSLKTVRVQVIRGNLEIVKFILLTYNDLYRAEMFLGKALEESTDEVIEYLLGMISVIPSTLEGKIEILAGRGKLEMLKLLEARGVAIPDGALVRATTYGRIEVLKYLLQKKYLRRIDDALLRAVELYDGVVALKVLLEEGDTYDISHLRSACEDLYKDRYTINIPDVFEKLELLLKHGLDPASLETESLSGRLTREDYDRLIDLGVNCHHVNLIRAFKEDNLEMAKEAFARGARVIYDSVKVAAQRIKSPEMLQLASSFGCKVNYAMGPAVGEHNLPVLKELQILGVSLKVDHLSRLLVSRDTNLVSYVLSQFAPRAEDDEVRRKMSNALVENLAERNFGSAWLLKPYSYFKDPKYSKALVLKVSQTNDYEILEVAETLGMNFDEFMATAQSGRPSRLLQSSSETTLL